MTSQPIGKLDHIGIAVKSIAEARKFFESILGARFKYDSANPGGGFRICVLDLSGLTIELLEPLGESSFLKSLIEKRGEGIHHLTLDVPDSKAACTMMKRQGVRVVDEVAWSPTSYEAFISPKTAHGVLIQIGSGYPTLANDPEWTKSK
jgi:lactoylglutathione lyase/methylmalonyl-CoA/ethylmalonyl-CoA epimerase